MVSLTRLTVHKPDDHDSEPKLPVTLGQVSTLGSFNTASDILPIESQSFSVAGKPEGKLTAPDIKERREHKCRNRTDSVGWFESNSHGRLEQPPDKSIFSGLLEGDLFMNWLDEKGLNCQIWIFTKETEGSDIVWRSMGWGSQRTGSKCRLVITEKGTPSFVAESTWKKKYRLKQPRILQ